MIRLLYSSEAAHDLTEQDIANILQKSNKNNPSEGITGVLVYGGNLFMQVLEGPELAVLKKYTTICDDKRNTNNKIIFITYTDNRLFGKWAMCHINCDPVDIRKIYDLNSKASETVPPENFTKTMREFMRRLSSAEVYSIMK